MTAVGVARVGGARQHEIEELAARLRELKDRSGRSYGSLARRLAVSQSTLYRYCAGETVPVEFAPLERFARLCGAGRDELLALHRLWNEADATRGGAAAARGAGDGGAAPDGPAAPERENGGAGTGAGAGTGEDADAAGAAGAAGGGAGSGKAGPAGSGSPGSVPREDGPQENAPREDAPQENASQGAGRQATGPRASGPHEPGSRPAGPAGAVLGSPAGRRSRVRRVRARAVAGAGAAVALALTALVALDSSPGGAGAPAASRETTRPAAEPPAPGGTSPSSSASPSPSASAKAKKKQKDKKKDGGGSDASRSGAPADGGNRETGPAGGGTAAGTPLTWTVSSHEWQYGCAHAYLVDRPADRVPPPPVEQDAPGWARALDAVHGGDTNVQVTVQGTSGTAVVLESLRVRVVERRPPVEAGVFRMDAGCGGALTPRRFDVDLDMPRPVARSEAGNDAGEEIPAVSFPYRVSASDPEVLLVTGRTVECDCSWYLELGWSSQGRSGTVRIDDRGQPFRTSGTAGMPQYAYGYGADGRWGPWVE